MHFNFSSFCNENKATIKHVVIDSDFGYVGYGLFVDTTEGEVQISGALSSIEAVHLWAENNQAMIRSFVTTGMVPPSQFMVDTYIGNLTKDLGILGNKQAEQARRRDVYKRLLDKGGNDLEFENEVREDVENYEVEIAKIDRHKVRLQGLLATAKNDPSSLFLPIGATVVLKNDFSIGEDWALDGGHWGPSPKNGTKGVVVGKPNRGEFGVVVAIYDDIEGPIEEYNPMMFYFHAKDLEVLELGKFADGTVCRSPDFVRTHVHNEFRTEYGDMVVIANGYPWRIHGFEIGRNSYWTEGHARSSLEDLCFLEPYDPDTHNEALRTPGM